VLLRGSNGAGKSTLLRVIATLLSPTYGAGRILGFDLLRDRAQIRSRIELLGHRTRLYEDLTAAENLRFAARLFGYDPAAIVSALDQVGLSDVAGERVRTYSQGMRQRVAVARAILRAPELLLMDEPYAGLDTGAREAVDDLARATRARGGTVLLATHEPSRGSVAGRTLFMQDGRMLPEGTEP
jgi:ABC-type multidrug transport system ATPase subunit